MVCLADMRVNVSADAEIRLVKGGYANHGIDYKSHMESYL